MKHAFTVLCLIVSIAMLLMTCAAAAEEPDEESAYWTTLEDKYYHARKDCTAIGESSYALSEAAANTFQKQPCPICMKSQETPEAVDLPPVEAAVYDGIWVIKFPSELLASFDMQAPLTPALQYCIPMLYARTVKEELDLRLAVTDNGSLEMNTRMINGDCYVIERPPKSYSDEFPMKWEAWAIEPDIFGSDDPALVGVSATREDVPKMSSKYKMQYRSKSSGLEIVVYRILGANIALMRQKRETELSMYCQLTFDGKLPGIPIQGYNDDGYDVYCCVLTGDELDALESGAVAGIDSLSLGSEPTADNGEAGGLDFLNLPVPADVEQE